MRPKRFLAATVAAATLAVVPGVISVLHGPAVSWANPCAFVGGRHVSVGGCADPGRWVDDVPPPPPDDTAPPAPPS